MSRLAWLSAAALFPVAADASFGGGGACKDFLCHLFFWGLILAVMGGLPISVALFIFLHVWFRHSARPRDRQVAIGAVAGSVAFLVAAPAAAFIGHAYKSVDPRLGFVLVYLVLGTLSVLYTRSRPRAANDAG